MGREEKFGKILTVMLIIIVLGLLGIIGFLLFQTISGNRDASDASAFVDQYSNLIIADGGGQVIPSQTDNNISDIPIIQVNEEEIQTTTTSSGRTKKQYKGFNTVGTIRIPAINLSYPILEKATTKSIEVAVAVIYGPGPNEIGNTVIVGHNYRNGAFFGSNDKLKLGDKVYIKDTSGRELKYNIYNIYTTSPDDGDYMIRDTNGKREVSLSTCTDNSKERLIIWAVEE